jgi:hypothetical protein
LPSLRSGVPCTRSSLIRRIVPKCTRSASPSGAIRRRRQPPPSSSVGSRSACSAAPRISVSAYESFCRRLSNRVLSAWPQLELQNARRNYSGAQPATALLMRGLGARFVYILRSYGSVAPLCWPHEQRRRASGMAQRRPVWLYQEPPPMVGHPVRGVSR